MTGLDNVARATAQIFRSKIAENADVLRTKIDLAEQARDELQRQLPALAYEANTEVEGAGERLAALLGEIGRAEEQVRLLQTALDEAERREQERLSDLDKKAENQRRRAIHQHVIALRRAGADYELGVRKQQELWEAMLTASGKLVKLVGTGSATAMEANALSPSRLSRLCVDELRRVAFPQHPHPCSGPTQASLNRKSGATANSAPSAKPWSNSAII